jgi:hypothetical protein
MNGSSHPMFLPLHVILDTILSFKPSRLPPPITFAQTVMLWPKASWWMVVSHDFFDRRGIPASFTKLNEFFHRVLELQDKKFCFLFSQEKSFAFSLVIRSCAVY